MNREIALFLIVVAVLGLFTATTLLSDPYERIGTPRPARLDYPVPPVVDDGEWGDAERIVKLLSGFERLGESYGDKGRTILVPYSDLVRVEPAELDPPLALPTPWILPPISPFPPTPYLRTFREDTVAAIAPKEKEEEDGEPPVEPVDEPPDEPTESVEDVLEGEQEEFRPEDWDMLLLPAGIEQYGTLTLTKASREKGFTKYDLLLPENRELECFFEQRDKESGDITGSVRMTLEQSNVVSVRFADTIENAYWSKRTVDRVRKGNAAALTELGRWTMEQAEEERYDRLKGLDLAAKTFREALQAQADDTEAILGLGEALHRAFRFDEEFRLYEEAVRSRFRPEIVLRQVRLYEKLDLHEAAADALDRVLTTSPGNTTARLRRGEARYRLGRFEEAIADFEEVARVASPEERTEAREGKARSLIRLGRPSEAETILADAEDARSLVTLGAARYALRKWDEAREAFLRATEADPENAQAMTNLGFTQAMTASDWDGIEEALATLDKGRELDPLNYYYPPLGRGFAEQRRGDEEARAELFTRSVDHYVQAAAALPTEPYAHYVLGRSLLRDGVYTGAREAFLEALKLDYRFADALLGAGTAAMELPGWPRARAELERAASLEIRAMEEPLSSRTAERAKQGAILALYRLGRAWLLSDDVRDETKRWEQAKRQFERVLELDRDHVPSINALAYVAYLMGEEDQALLLFDKSSALDPENAAYPSRQKARIIDRQGRRLWIETFDRQSSATVGNSWLQLPRPATPLSPRLHDGRVRVSGRMTSTTSTVWLTHGDVIKTTRGRNDLNNRFIRARTVVEMDPANRVSMQFIVFVQTNQRIRSGVGLERSPTGEVLLVHRKSSDDEWTKEAAKDESGSVLTWPEGPATLTIERTDHERGEFTLGMNGRTLGKIVPGLKRNRGALSFGFRWSGVAGDALEATVHEVELEIYYQ